VLGLHHEMLADIEPMLESSSKDASKPLCEAQVGDRHYHQSIVYFGSGQLRIYSIDITERIRPRGRRSQ
jgi:hypothetical protein